MMAPGPVSSIGQYGGLIIMPDKGVKVMCHMCGHDMYILGVDEPAICGNCRNKTWVDDKLVRYTEYMKVFGGRRIGKNS
jgi:hypothetical protein